MSLLTHSNRFLHLVLVSLTRKRFPYYLTFKYQEAKSSNFHRSIIYFMSCEALWWKYQSLRKYRSWSLMPCYCPGCLGRSWYCKSTGLQWSLVDFDIRNNPTSSWRQSQRWIPSGFDSRHEIEIEMMSRYLIWNYLFLLKKVLLHWGGFILCVQ